MVALCITWTLVGCESTPVKTETETVEVLKPVLYCPAPDSSILEKPHLPIHNITPQMSPGEVAKHYKATIRVLIDYSKRQGMTLEQYKQFSEQLDQQHRELLQNTPSNLPQ